MTYTYIAGVQPEFVRSAAVPGLAEAVGTQGYYEDHYSTATKREAPTDGAIRTAQLAALADDTASPVEGNMVIGSANMYYQTFYAPLSSTDYWTELQAYYNPHPIAVTPDRISDSDHRFTGDPSGPLGSILWWPEDVPIEDRPSPDAGWIWADDPEFLDRGKRRCDIVSVTMAATSSDDVPIDRSGGPSPNLPSAILAQGDGVTWSMMLGHENASGWTSSSGTHVGVGTFTAPTQAASLDLSSVVDEYGRCVVWTRTPPPDDDDPSTAPVPSNPAGTGSGSPDPQLAYGWTIAYTPTVTWTFRAPAFYWVLGSEETPPTTWQRAHPRDPDGLGVSSGHRAWPRPRSVQASGRRGGGYR